MATGLLIILLGKFTKQSQFFSEYDKEYEATLCLGISTDTGDREGAVLKEVNTDLCKDRAKDLKEVFLLFKGEISQTPPMFSAKKLEGKKLYELARKGITVKREPKTVSIKEIEILQVLWPHVTFYVKCSKGTYIRQLAHDIGEKVGCGAHLTSLRRTNIGPFSVDRALLLEGLEDALDENILQPK